MKTVRRKIQLIDQSKSDLQESVEFAIESDISELFGNYCEAVRINYALAGYDIDKLRVKRKVTFAE